MCGDIRGFSRLTPLEISLPATAREFESRRLRQKCGLDREKAARIFPCGFYFLGFIKSYKHLDNLCKDINGIGVTGYINDMEDRPSAEYRIAGWKQDYLKLKHYRYIRNQIAHENYAEEENMSSPEDTVWLDNFYNRIMNQTDPLALYYKETVHQQVKKPTKTVTPKNVPATPSSYQQYQKDRKSAGCAVMLIVVFVIILSLIVHFFL